MKQVVLYLLSMLALLPCSGAFAAPAAFFVAPNGRDTNPGTLQAPFASLERARDAVRARKEAGALPQGGITVFVRGGDYQRAQSFTLTTADSGTAGSPITYRAYGNEPVHLIGGRRLPAAAFQPVRDPLILQRLDPAAQGKVLQADLKALGITDYGELPVRSRGATPQLELFCNDQRMTLARWPNQGWTTVGKIIARGANPRQGVKDSTLPVFEYTGDRPARWRTADGVWLNGYWCFDWYEETIKVGAIDTEKHTITLADCHNYGLGGGNPGPRRFYALNLLEELDRPGEYYMDGKQGILYFWPPTPLKQAHVSVSLLNDPLIALTEASYINLRGLTLEVCRGTALTVQGGLQARVLGCTVRNTGGMGIMVQGGTRHRVQGCDIYDTGTLGLLLEGGDRKTLTAAHLEAINNHIHHFARRQRTYASGIQVGGVGNIVAHNLLHDAPHQAIGLSGNDHVIEFNEIHHVILETDDCGAFYMGRDPSTRGTMIRYNFWHDLGSPMGHGNNAVYFDDGDGGQTVYGNVFLRCGEPAKGSMGAVFSHGGHDNLVENNLFIACKRAMGSTPWDDRRWKNSIAAADWQNKLLREVDITRPPYLTRYPELKDYMTDPTGRPRINRAVNNVIVMCGAATSGNFQEEGDFVTDKDPGFVDPAHGNFGLRKTSPVFNKVPGFKPIPFAQIGLQKDAYRPVLPKRRWTGAPLAPLPKLATAAAFAAKTTPPPVFRVPRSTAALSVDGDITPAEWLGANPAQAMVVAQDIGGTKLARRSLAWLSYDADALRLAVLNEVDPTTKLGDGHAWGQDDAVEAAFANPAAGKDAPILVLRGYPGGFFESSDEAGAPAAAVERARAGVSYAARIVDAGHWAAEWRIPFAALGINPAQQARIAFNLTVRKTADNLWVMWEGTHDHSWEVGKAGFLELSR